MDWLRDVFGEGKAGEARSPEETVFHKKYHYFKNLLTSNNRALEIMAELENIVYQDKPFSYGRVMVQIESLITETFSIVEDLNAISAAKYPELFDVTERISQAILDDLRKRKKLEPTGLVIPMERLSIESILEVGGKAANLGEVYNRVHLPVPPGFAVTAYACQHFLARNNLDVLAADELRNLDVNATDKLIEVSRRIQSAVMGASLPDDLAEAILRAASDLEHKSAPPMRLSVRSSATVEDSDASFAGQHSTVLNVSRDNLPAAYKEVVASTFNPRAVYYRRRKGYFDQDVIMSVACILMVDAKASGVMYTMDPNDSRHAVIMISAVWGLGLSLVDGSTSNDFYQIDKETGEITVAQIGSKGSMLNMGKGDGILEKPVPASLTETACLDPSLIRTLVDYGLQLEEHYGHALDVEWAVDQTEKLFILQARPLKAARKPAPEHPPLPYPVLLEGGATASEGAASGIAWVITSDHTLHQIPDGAIVVARQTAPRYVPLMGRIRGFVTDVGSVTGHMASVAREFQIPTLVGTGNATETIPHGEEITLDATNKIVYRGHVGAMLKKKPVNPMKGSPKYNIIHAALKKIATLNLTDPREVVFKAEACSTLHDVIRFSHEMAMQEMFRIGEEVRTESITAVPLRVSLPLRVFVVDLGGGLSLPSGAKAALLEHVTSLPFKALLKGMTHEDVDWSQDLGGSLQGLGADAAESLLRDPLTRGPMGGPTYAIVGSHYLNFSARLGYHFTTIDTYCGPLINDNYINFYFKGGAADIGRRTRRALLVAQIIWRLGFKVEHKSDMVRGEIKKYQSEVLARKLDLLGRLMGSVRLLDLVLSDDGRVDWYVDEFFEGNYTFKERSSGSPVGQGDA